MNAVTYHAFLDELAKIANPNPMPGMSDPTSGAHSAPAGIAGGIQGAAPQPKLHKPMGSNILRKPRNQMLTMKNFQQRALRGSPTPTKPPGPIS